MNFHVRLNEKGDNELIKRKVVTDRRREGAAKQGNLTELFAVSDPF